jgi:hypothetical protein
VCGGIAAQLALVPRRPQDVGAAGDDGPDRDVAVGGRPLGELERAAHQALVIRAEAAVGHAGKYGRTGAPAAARRYTGAADAPERVRGCEHLGRR